MTNLQPISIIKRYAKDLSAQKGIPHNAALKTLAIENGFANYHEMQVVASKYPLEQRLLRAAFGIDTLSDAIHQDEVLWEIDEVLDDAMSGTVAETNASMFTVDGMDAEVEEYDHSTGTLILDASITYSGDQDQDRPYHGTTFFIGALVKLIWRNGRWFLSDDEDCLTITGCKSDVDRDHEAEQEWEEWLREQHELNNSPS